MLADYDTKGSYPTERAGRLTGDQQTNKPKGIMSPISTLTLPHTLTHWGMQASKRTCYPPSSLLSFQGEKPSTDRPSQDSTVPSRERKPKEHGLSFTGLHGLVRIPQHRRTARYFQTMWNVDTTTSFLRSNSFLTWKRKIATPIHCLTKGEFSEVRGEAYCLDLTANLKTVHSCSLSLIWILFAK